MPRTDDAHTIRRILRGDPPWSVYMLADLAPPYAAHAEWHAAGDGVLLLYRGFAIPVLVASGPEEDLAVLLREIRDRRMYLSVRRPALAALEAAGYRIEEAHAMLRMALDPARFPALDPCSTHLGPADFETLRALYADGEPYGEAPPFFSRQVLENGVYHGICEGGELAAAAGTHVFAPEEDVAGIGNVYTRRDRRGQGLGLRATAGVTAELAARGIGTIALNVAPGNAPAIRIYERLGFFRYCEYYEGVAVKT